MIEVYQHAEPGTVTAENGCYWRAETIIDGQPYAARSRRGAPHELARLLVAAGIPDQSVIVRSFGIAGHLAYGSLHAMAACTIEENSGTAPRRVKWRANPMAEWPGKGVGEAQSTGSFPPEVNQDLPPSTMPEIGAPA